MKRSKTGQPESTETSEPRSTRREVLRGGLLIAGAAAVARITSGGAKTAHAADGQPLVIGQTNSGNSPTTLVVPPGGALHGLSVTTFPGDPNDPGNLDVVLSTLQGTSTFAVGVEGRSDTGTGVLGHVGGALHTDPNQPIDIVAGVFGAGVDAVGVAGRSLLNSGVVGQTGGSFAGDPNENWFPYAGVSGVAGVPGDPNMPDSFAGVFGYAWDPNSPGVLARSSNTDGGVALNVQGRALFSSAGTGTIPAGVDRVDVVHPSATATSTVLVTLSSDPVGGRRLKYVSSINGRFTVVLSSKAKVPVNFGYLVLN